MLQVYQAQISAMVKASIYRRAYTAKHLYTESTTTEIQQTSPKSKELGRGPSEIVSTF